jgi:hypothetical protein
MGCQVNVGNAITCDTFAPGITEFYVCSYNSFSSATINASNVITGITMSGSNTYFYIYDLPQDSSMGVQNINRNPTNGTYAIEQVLTIQMNNLSTFIQNKVKTLMQSKLLGIVKDNQNQYWMFGYQNGLFAQGTNTAETGQNYLTDKNGYTLSFTAKEPNMAYEVSSAALVGITSY